MKASDPSPLTAVFDTHQQAEETVRTLGRSGFDMKKLSIVGKGFHSEEHPVGFYTTADRVKTWGGIGGFWGGIWGLLFAPAVFFFSQVGLIAVAGPVVASLVAALESAVVVGGLSALGAALFSLGMTKEQAIKYEAAIKADKYLVVVHGTAEDIEKAKSIIGAHANGAPV